MQLRKSVTRQTAFTALYSFQGPRDGRKPIGTTLVVVDGELYGTTAEGGKNNRGTIFAIDPGDGAERIVYSFKGGGFSGTDGATPKGRLIFLQDTLYGTTGQGGSGGPWCFSGNGCGTIFGSNTTGTETVLHSFGTRVKEDGVFPQGGLSEAATSFYGTTDAGGAGDGTVFVSSPNGRERIIHTFEGVPKDGAFPIGDVTYERGIIYGTTQSGGSGSSCGSQGCGAVFEIDVAKRKERLLYSFSGGSDGAVPVSNLVDVKGTLYGVTAGLRRDTCSKGCGNVFAVTQDGKERVIHTFTGGEDGAEPFGDLLYYRGNFYGVTNFGGGSGCPLRNSVGCGTVFKLTPSGHETILHRFSGDDGFIPQTNLIQYNATLYGTTTFGGTKGRGTVFAIAP